MRSLTLSFYWSLFICSITVQALGNYRNSFTFISPSYNLQKIANADRYLSVNIIGHAKRGGHQSASAESAELYVAFNEVLRPEDHLIVQEHSWPAQIALLDLMGILSEEHLKGFRKILSAYSGRQDQELAKLLGIDLGISFPSGELAASDVSGMLFAYVLQYLRNHPDLLPSTHRKELEQMLNGHVYSVLGDAEVMQDVLLAAAAFAGANQVEGFTGLVKFNRQRLEPATDWGKAKQIRETYKGLGWRVIEVRFGSRMDRLIKEGGIAGEKLERRLLELSEPEIQELLQSDGEIIRYRLTTGSPANDGVRLMLKDFSDDQLLEIVQDLSNGDPRARVQRISELQERQSQLVLDRLVLDRLVLDDFIQRLDQLDLERRKKIIELGGEGIRQWAIFGEPSRVDPDIEALLASYKSEEVLSLFSDLGGHDINKITPSILEARDDKAPTLIIYWTEKGRGLPIHSDPYNHGQKLPADDVKAIGEEVGVVPSKEWEVFPEPSQEKKHLQEIARQRIEVRKGLMRVRKEWVQEFVSQLEGLPIAEAFEIEPRFGESTMEYFNRLQAEWTRSLRDLEREPSSDREKVFRILGKRLVLGTADVGHSTGQTTIEKNLGGPYSPFVRPDFRRWYGHVRPLAKYLHPNPKGQFIDIPISEPVIFALISAFAKATELLGIYVDPTIILYESFHRRSLAMLVYGLYLITEGPKPTSISLGGLYPDGAQHQSFDHLYIVRALPTVESWIPFWPIEVGWYFGAHQNNRIEQLREAREGTSLDLRLTYTPTPVNPSLVEVIRRSQFYEEDESDEEILLDVKKAALRGGFRLLDWREYEGYKPGDNVINIFAAGEAVQEALEAAMKLQEEYRIFLNVIQVTNPHLLLDERDNHHLADHLLPESERKTPVLTVIDAVPQTLQGIGDRVSVPFVRNLGITKFGISGDRKEVLKHYGIDADSIVNEAITMLDGIAQVKLEVSL